MNLSTGRTLKFSEFRLLTEGWLYTEYADELHDLEFERAFAKFLGEYEQEWARLQKDYNWNRETRGMPGQHFAIDVKVYAWPDLEEINSVLGLELDQNELDNYWWRFMEETRDAFTEDIEQHYGWIKSTGWGGKSGGWLVIWPDRNEEDFEDEPSYHLSQYAAEKLHMSQEEILKMQQEESDSKLQKLISLGLAEPSEQLAELKRDISNIMDEMGGYLAQMRRYRADLEEIAEIPKEFEKNAVADFTEWLREMVD